MSDQDFFFDDDEPKPAKSTKSAKATTGKTTGSGNKPSGTPSKSSAGSPSAKRVPETLTPAGGFMEQSMSMPIVSLLVVIGLLVGVIVGFLIGGGMQSQSPAITGPGAVGTTGTGTSGTGAGGATATPGQLTPEQLQQGLPSGHPSVGATTTPAP